MTEHSHNRDALPTGCRQSFTFRTPGGHVTQHVCGDNVAGHPRYCYDCRQRQENYPAHTVEAGELLEGLLESARYIDDELTGYQGHGQIDREAAAEEARRIAAKAEALALELEQLGTLPTVDREKWPNACRLAEKCASYRPGKDCPTAGDVSPLRSCFNEL